MTNMKPKLCAQRTGRSLRWFFIVADGERTTKPRSTPRAAWAAWNCNKIKPVWADDDGDPLPFTAENGDCKPVEEWT